MIDGLLTLARSESTMLDMVPIDLADVAGDVVGEFVGEAADAGIRLDLDLETAIVQGDRSLLTRLIANLVQNGLRYNRAGGMVDVGVRAESGFATLTISNTGPIVSQEEIDSLFKPFARGAWAQRNRAGHGLGLAIVQSVVTAHGGTVAAEPGAWRRLADHGEDTGVGGECGKAGRVVARPADQANQTVVDRSVIAKVAMMVTIAATARMPGAISGSRPVMPAFNNSQVVDFGCSSRANSALPLRCW